MILEGVVTTENQNGTINVSPMGPHLDGDDAEIQRFTLRPYQTSRTYQNLKRLGVGVLLHPVMVFRGVLYRRLSRDSRRARTWRGQF